MKDATCKECSLNAAQWKYSIFEIVRAHREYELNQNFEIQASNIHIFFDGSHQEFPYLPAKKSFTAAHCTLEKDLFLINRSKILNPLAYDLDEMLPAFFNSYQSKHIFFESSADHELDKYRLKNTKQILESLAKKSKNGLDFLAQAVNFRKCDHQVEAPSSPLTKTLALDPQEISAAIARGLSLNHSVFVKLCGLNIRYEKNVEDCASHAVVIKKQTEAMYLIADSAFFSLRAMESDGSVYIPKDVVVQAAYRYIKNRPQGNPSMSEDQTQAYFDMIHTAANSVLAEFIVDYWHQSVLTKRKALGTFLRQVIEPTLVTLNISEAEVLRWRSRFEKLDLDSRENLMLARNTVAAFLTIIQLNEINTLSFAKILVHGHWLDELENYTDKIKIGENISWFN